VRVPVFVGHGESVNVELANEVTVEQCRAMMRAFPGLTVIDHRADEGYVTPVEAAGEDQVYVSRIRRDPTVKHGLSFWCVADNLRKGAALNAVQIAELLCGIQHVAEETDDEDEFLTLTVKTEGG
jgi:aspartate-semialdehyde dehydrogenase